MPKLFIYGFPALYGGAGTELHHQIYAWDKIPGLELAIIPNQPGYKNEPLYKEMENLGIPIYNEHNFNSVKPEDAVINFCSSLFLENVGHIRQKTKRTIFVNCMTFIFEKEKECHSKGLIGHSLYQRPQVMQDHQSKLEALGSKANFQHFVPYFHDEGYEYAVKDQEYVHIGRISRDAKDKYTPFNRNIYEGIVSPKLKRGHFLGYGSQAKSIVGDLPSWINGYIDHSKLPVKDFYKLVDFIVQPTNTTENWPRIGLEAMHSGVPLVVDNRGGWQYMIEHGVTGFLCNHERDFMYYGSKLAYELDTRERIADAALQRARELSSIFRSRESWCRVFERVFN